MLSFYSGIYKLLGGLLELLLGRLRVGIDHTCLILYLDVDGLRRDLLALSRLVSDTAIHGVVHHASVEGVWRLISLLCRVAGDDGTTDYSQSGWVLRLALLLHLRAAFYRATHCVASRILLQLLCLRDVSTVCILWKSAAKLTLIVAIRWLTIVFLFIGLLLLLLYNLILSHLYVFVLRILISCIRILILVLTISRAQSWRLMHYTHLVLNFDRAHCGSYGAIVDSVITLHVELLLSWAWSLAILVTSSVLLLDLHVSIFIFLAYSRPCVIPGTFCVSLIPSPRHNWHHKWIIVLRITVNIYSL